MSVETPFTQEMLDALNFAIASGTHSVSYNGKTLQYRSLDEMLKARDIIMRQLELIDSTQSSRHIRVLGRKTSV